MGNVAELTLAEVRDRIERRVMPTLLRSVQALLRTSEFRSFADGTLTIALQGAGLKSAAERNEPGLLDALKQEFGARIPVVWAFDGAPTVESGRDESTVLRNAEEDEMTYSEMDESPILTDDLQKHLILENFPGAEEVS